ncbi:MAG: nitroreductase family deazaflavin-dependent oxidoreductase [Rhodoglobus sp.]
MSDWNDRIIAEFRANDGKVGGPFEGAHLLLLGTTGAKSGVERLSPMVYFEVEGALFVIASKAGAPSHPAWYHNLVANPRVRVEQATDHGVETFEAGARPVTGKRRDELFAQFSARNPGFAQYKAKTDRVIPVVEISRTAT